MLKGRGDGETLEYRQLLLPCRPSGAQPGSVAPCPLSRLVVAASVSTSARQGTAQTTSCGDTKSPASHFSFFTLQQQSARTVAQVFTPRKALCLTFRLETCQLHNFYTWYRTNRDTGRVFPGEKTNARKAHPLPDVAVVAPSPLPTPACYLSGHPHFIYS